MRLAPAISSRHGEALLWAAICERHPNEWVCLLDVEQAVDGSIISGRVLTHDRSMRRMLAQMGASQPSSVVVHTAGRPLLSPRMEMTDEIRDIIRSRR